MRSKKKSLSATKLKQQQDHDAWLRKMGAHPDQVKKNLPHNAKGKRLGITKLPDYKAHQSTRTANTSDVVIGNTNKKDKHPYGRDPLGDKERRDALKKETRLSSDKIKSIVNGVSSKRKFLKETDMLDENNIIVE